MAFGTNLKLILSFAILSVQLIVNVTSVNEQCPSLPRIEYVIKSDTSVLNKSNTYTELYVPNIIPIEIKCSCSSPIKFQFHGQLPHKLSSSKANRKSQSQDWKDTASFCYETSIRLTTDKKATGRYDCSILSSQETASLYLFADGGHSPYLLGAGGSSVSVSTNLLQSVLEIPCVTTNPNITVALEKDGRQLSKNDYDFYDPKHGFTIKISNSSDALGIYKCIAINSTKWDFVSIHVQKINDAKISTLHSSIGNIKNPITILDSGKKETSEFICNFPGGVSSFVYVECNSPSECNNAQKCFLEDGTCDSSCDCKTEESCSYPYLLENHIEAPEDCKQLSRKFTGSSGILRCIGKNTSMHYSVSYFTDLNGSIVMESENIATADVLQIAPIPNDWEAVEELWVEEHANFTCNASRFKFSAGFKWLFLLKNGTVIETFAQDFQNPESQIFYSITSQIRISDPNIDRLICMAPVLNSNEWLDVAIHLNVRNSSAPQFVDAKNYSIKTQNKPEVIHFLIGKANQSITCAAEGLPIPEISWYKFGTEVAESNFSITIRNEVVKSSFAPNLYIPQQDNGTWFVCNATNVKGSVFRNYTIYLQNEQIASNQKSSSFLYIMVVIVCILSLTVLLFLFIREKRQQGSYIRLRKEDEGDFLKGKQITEKDNLAQNPPYISIPYDGEIRDRFEIPDFKNTLCLEESELGKGEFGMVYKGKLKGGLSEKVVAVKTIKEPPDYSAFLALLSELKILSYIGAHENVIQLIGAVTKNIRKLEAYVVVEYCHFGDLKSYLIQHRGSFHNEINDGGNITVDAPIGNYVQFENSMRTADLMRWAQQIAAGMEYLAEKQVVHRDLAARNVLLTDALAAKITDFGLSKNLYQSEKTYYRRVSNEQDNPQRRPPQLPWRWLPLESMRQLKFSVHSDVWAYGITLWEMFSLGDDPYPQVADVELPNFLADGKRNDQPPFANSAIYAVMDACWKHEAEERPTFTELRQRFEGLQANIDDNPI